MPGWVTLTIAAFLVAPARLRADDVVVFAATSLTDAVEEIGRGYERASGHHLTFSFGASSDLARQIEAGAGADVFFSADAAQMDRLVRSGLVRAADRAEVLSNTLVVIVPRDSPLVVRAAADLVGVRRLALADPEAVPAGVYARMYLQSAGLWEQLRDRVVPTLDVRAARAAVEAGHADAGIVYRTDAAGSKRARIAFEVPRAQGPTIVYVLAPLAGSKTGAARGFVQALRSPEAAAVFERHGFVVPARR